MSKDFNLELLKFISFIKNNLNFAFVRLSDGEEFFLNGDKKKEKIDLKTYWSWKHDDKHNEMRKWLLESSSYVEDNYYIGLPTHGGKNFFYELKRFTKQSEEYLTYACLFMDSNYPHFIDKMMPVLKERNVICVLHEKCDLKLLDLNILKLFKIGDAAYIYNLDLIDEIKEYIKTNNINDVVFLVTGGPFANILIYELWKYNKNNTYIDIGSALDPFIGLGKTRGYHTYNDTNQHFCVNQYHVWEALEMKNIKK